ncbi:hypothetical protein MASR2M78_03720 [Treponema sp.]
MANCIESALSQGIRLFRLYPAEQGWTMAHSVFVRATELLNASAIRAVLVEDQFRNIITLRNLLSDHIAIITSPHFYSMSEWMDELFKLPEVYLTIRRLQGPGVISDIVQNHGSDRLLYASDTPLGSTGAINRMLASEPGYEGLLDRIWENGNKILEGRV